MAMFYEMSSDSPHKSYTNYHANNGLSYKCKQPPYYPCYDYYAYEIQHNEHWHSREIRIGIGIMMRRIEPWLMMIILFIPAPLWRQQHKEAPYSHYCKVVVCR
jgi:hypothetical protein